MLHTAVKAVSPKGAETEQRAKLGNRLGKDNMVFQQADYI